MDKAGVISDEERCRLIAELDDFRGYENRPCMDYAYDLNATMRAARRLPQNMYLQVNSDGYASTRRFEPKYAITGATCVDDPARAAFLVLSDFLAEQQRSDYLATRGTR